MLAHCKAGCDFRDVVYALRDQGHMAGPVRDAQTLSDTRHREQECAYALKKSKQAQMCWEDAQPISGTLGEAYLRSRRITCRLPSTLRFHARCWHPGGKHHLAVIGLVEGAEQPAIHRTYLAPDKPAKADIQPNKAMLGSCSGGAVRLSGQGGPLVIVEGIETGLSLLSGILSGPAEVWAALSTSGMKAVRLPAKRGRLIIAADGDKAGHDAAEALARRAHDREWDVHLLPAPEGEDWNDVLLREMAP